MMSNSEQEPQSNFKKGMTLDQYLVDLQTNKANNFSVEKQEEDLYETSGLGLHSLSKKLITYQIRESDEDNYEESIDESNGNQFHGYRNNAEFINMSKSRNQMQKRSNKNIINMEANFQENVMGNSKGFRVRKFSNSPYNNIKKDYSPPHINKSMAKSLYNSGWKIHKDTTSKIIAPTGATLYGSFLKGIKEKTNEKNFKKKNTRDLQNVMKYEKNLGSKYSYINQSDFRIDGITDRLYERKNKWIK